VRADIAPGQRAPLDAATLILELDIAALIGQAGDSLRQHRDGADRHEQPSWWRRLSSARARDVATDGMQ
jgi:hypothetical protein